MGGVEVGSSAGALGAVEGSRLNLHSFALTFGETGESNDKKNICVSS
jgi:hypothetical protein